MAFKIEQWTTYFYLTEKAKSYPDLNSELPTTEIQNRNEQQNKTTLTLYIERKNITRTQDWPLFKTLNTQNCYLLSLPVEIGNEN